MYMSLFKIGLKIERWRGGLLKAHIPNIRESRLPVLIGLNV